MPFPFEEIQERFGRNIEQERLGHAYLLTGDRAEALEELALELAGRVLQGSPQEHPDFHLVRPQSKSRQITVEQIRELERELYLKPYQAPLKIAVIFAAERMCLGTASAANAFLKTLEEPPAHTLILLTSSRPAQLLPTLLSRCLRLDLGYDQVTNHSGPEPEWIRAWYQPHPSPALRAYARAQYLQEHWQNLREKAEVHLKGGADQEEEVLTALIEAEFQLSRQESIAQLQRWYWRQSGASAGTTEPERVRAVLALEQLQAALNQNIEVNLAVERACLCLEGLI